MTAGPLDQSALIEELLGESKRDERVRRLATDLVADWAREADTMPDPSEVHRYQREAFDETLQSVGRDRRDALELELLKRQSGQLSAEAFTLAQAVANGSEDNEASIAQGRRLLDRCEQLADALKRFGANQITESVHRKITEAMLDALYAVERKAMSPRLAREMSPADAGPPDVR